MSKELTNKTWVMVLRDKSRIFLTENQVNKVKAIINRVEFMDIDGRLISKYAVLYIIPSHEYDSHNIEKMNERKGMWKCQYGNWHSRNEECGCGEKAKWKI